MKTPIQYKLKTILVRHWIEDVRCGSKVEPNQPLNPSFAGNPLLTGVMHSREGVLVIPSLVLYPREGGLETAAIGRRMMAPPLP